MLHFLLAILLSAATLRMGVAAEAAGFELPITGRITEKNGKPVAGPVQLSVSFYHTEKDGSAILTVTEGLESVPLQEGIFQVKVKLSGPDWQRVFPGVDQPVFVEFVDLSNDNTPYPRFQVAMAPLAGKIPVDGKTIGFDSEGRAGLVIGGANGAGKLLASDGAGALAWIDAATVVAQAAANSLDGDVTGISSANTVTKIQGRAVAATAPASLQVLQWDGSQWAPSTLPQGLAAGTMSGALSMGGQTLSGLAAPQGAADATTKSYSDAYLGGAALDQTSRVNAYVVKWDNTNSKFVLGADQVGSAGGGIASINGLNASSQTMVIGSAGTAPAFSPSGSVHTLNIPLAATGSVTAGLLSNSDYTSFNSKVSSVASGTGVSVSTSGTAATVSLANTAVTAGSYSRASITVDAQGRLTAASNGANVALGSEVAGILPVASGGTGGTTAQSARTSLGLGTIATYNGIGSTEITDGTIADVDISATAAIADTKLATISTAGKVTNAATTATSANTASAIVARDASGNFTAGTITAALSGNATSATTAGSVSGTVAVANGGTGATTLAANAVLLGNGTSALQAVAPGTSGNVLTSNGTTWTSSAAAADSWSVSGSDIYRSSGKVGIGTTNPIGPLDLGASVGNKILLYPVSTTSSYGFGIQAGLLQMFTNNGADMAFGTGSSSSFTEFMRIKGSGSVGIGIATPSLTMHVRGANAAPATSGTTQNGTLRIDSASYANGLDIGNYAAAPFGTWLQAADRGNLAVNFPIILQPNGGNVGIGTASPSTILDVESSDASAGLDLNNTATDGDPRIAFQLSGTSIFTMGVDDSDSDKFKIGTTAIDTSTRLTIDGSGNVGIGTTTPTAKFQVNGQVTSALASDTTLAMDMNLGNFHTNNVAAGTLVLNNMVDATTYTVILTNASGGNYGLSGSSVSTWKCSPACASSTVTVTAGTHTALSITKTGTTAYVFWGNGL